MLSDHMINEHVIDHGEFVHVRAGCQASICGSGRAAVHAGGFVTVREGGWANIFDGGHAIVYQGGIVYVHKKGWAYVYVGGEAIGTGEIVWEWVEAEEWEDEKEESNES